MTTNKFIQLASMAVALFGPVLAAVAGGDGMPLAPKPEESSPQWYPILYTVVFIAGACVVAFKNAKRTHLD